MTAAGEFHTLIDPCPHCPHPDRCRREESCRATWHPDTRTRVHTAEHAAALTRPCPDCQAEPDQPCRNLHTGEPLTHQPAHLNRITPRPEKATP